MSKWLTNEKILSIFPLKVFLCQRWTTFLSFIIQQRHNLLRCNLIKNNMSWSCCLLSTRFWNWNEIGKCCNSKDHCRIWKRIPDIFQSGSWYSGSRVCHFIWWLVWDLSTRNQILLSQEIIILKNNLRNNRWKHFLATGLSFE